MGVRAALEKGVIGGYPGTDIRVTLLSGRVHEVDSAATDFQVAGSMAIRQAVRQGRPALLEPIMAVDVNVPAEQVGAVVGALGRRRGSVSELRSRGSVRNVEGEVPLS